MQEQQCNKANRCDLGQRAVEQGFNLPVSCVAFTVAQFCQRSQSENMLISRLLVAAAARTMRGIKMKRRRQQETERLVSSLPAEEIV